MTSQPRLIAMTQSDRKTALAGPPEQVAALLLEAVGAGHDEAQLLAGKVHLDGSGVSRNPAQALRCSGLEQRPDPNCG